MPEINAKPMFLYIFYICVDRGSYEGAPLYFKSNEFDEFLLKIHIRIVRVEESYFGKKKKVKFIWASLPLQIKSNRI